jgi:hypothetical protein
MALQWEAGPDRFATNAIHCLNCTDTSAEYALNAVNQGVTALGIKGTAAG